MIPGVPYDAEVEYIDSVIPAYIDTGIKMQGSYTIHVDAAFLSGGPEFSSMLGTQNDAYCCIRLWKSQSKIEVFWYGGFLKPSNINANNMYDRHVFIISRNGTYVDDVLLKGQTPALSTAYSIKIAGYNEGNTQRQGRCRYWGFSIVDENNHPVIDLIPVRVGQTGYMYDRVSKRLFGNKGTGSFVLGPDVAKPVMGLYGMRKVTFPMDYIQDGLAAHFDAICNGPNGEHNTNTYKWYDLTGNEQPLVTWGNIIPIWKDNYAYNFRAYFRNTAISRDYTARGYTEEFVTCNGWANPLNDAVIGVSLTTNNWLQTSNNAYRFGVFGKYPVILYSSDVVNSRSRKCITFSIRPDGIGTLYIDGGSIVAPMSNKAHPYTTLSGSHAIGVGKNDNSVYNKGIHAYRVYNRALSPAEIAHNYAIDKARFNLP